MKKKSGGLVLCYPYSRSVGYTLRFMSGAAAGKVPDEENVFIFLFRSYTDVRFREKGASEKTCARQQLWSERYSPICDMIRFVSPSLAACT